MFFTGKFKMSTMLLLYAPLMLAMEERKWTLQELEDMLMGEVTAAQAAESQDPSTVLDIDVEAIINQYEPIKINPKLVIPGSYDFNEFIEALDSCTTGSPARLMQSSVIADLKTSIQQLNASLVKKEQKQVIDLVTSDPVATQATQELIEGVKNSQVQMVVKAIQSGADVNWVNAYDEFPLLLAVKSGNSEILKLLLMHPKITVRLANSKGYTSLMMAAMLGNIYTIRALLSHKSFFNISAQDRAGNTALHCAVFARHLEVIKLLVTCHASLQVAKNNQNRNVIDFAQYLLAKTENPEEKAQYMHILDFLNKYLEQRELSKKQLKYVVQNKIESKK